jgi:hypothetical protein
LAKAIKDTAAMKSYTREQLWQPYPATNDPPDMQNSRGRSSDRGAALISFLICGLRGELLVCGLRVHSK